MPLRLLHISDIHFHADTPGWDEDEDLRNELIYDVQRLVSRYGEIDAVLVGGDIAFSAQPQEYSIALDWIDRILQACGLPRGRVWTVPGNHDVDRSTVRASEDVKSFRTLMANCAPQAVDSKLKSRIGNSPTAGVLMLPLSNYNQFAENFFCTTQTDSLAWRDSSLSVDGVQVILTGINSVMNSGPEDDLNTLVVGTQQCRLPRVPGAVHVAMLHHPPRWIRDWAQISPYLDRAHVVLFGHEHAFEATQAIEGGGIQVSAGAVAPERSEAGEIAPFIPTYNLITLSISDGYLAVDIVPRLWSLTGTCFDDHPGGARSYTVELDSTGSPLRSPQPEPDVASASPLVAPPEESVDAGVESVETRQSLRDTGIAFLSIPPLRRVDIARRLGVLDDNDMRLPIQLLSRTILERVREQDLIDDLIQAIGTH